ncbi:MULTISPECIES: tRNA (guanosine(46)-N7)-methyltransferase TrmB [unclassified Limnothrix]|uniref:tRNA (guanosine(46)-N7)-methyltransferase TrmB n=1 Tax=unclassified Limnothrix TaxID=2632864 RepID=UPI001F5493C5|nr:MULTISPECIES: tRNA (guanosine(46)-N7)-methyltransferase TrmB [unclassified Limnothrix]
MRKPPVALVRVREHVNPLSRHYDRAIEPPNWSQLFRQLDRPLHLDIGCAKGHFILAMGAQEPTWNFLGLEIREPLVHQANRWAEERGLENVRYLPCNANRSIRPLLASLPPGIVQRVTIQFPDPWFKKRHQKRRVVQPSLVKDLAEFLPLGAQVFVQSDIEDVAIEMRDRFCEHAAFRLTHSLPWLTQNPLPIPTEREKSVLDQGLPVYRALFDRI